MTRPLFDSEQVDRQLDAAKQLRSDFLRAGAPEFRRWITGTQVIASMFGLAILGMALMGAAGMNVKNVEVTAVRVVE